MLFQRMVITLVLLLGSCCISTYPVYPESSSAQDLIPMDFYLADGVVGSVTDSKPPAGLQPSRNLNQALSAPGEGASHNQKAARIKGNKSILQEDVHDRLVEDIDAVLWKMVGVGELQSQGFTQTRPFSNPSGEVPRNVWTPECSASPGEIHQPQTHPKGDAIPGKKWC
ncbi:uncharacterized protein LOC121232514 isoform X3 [Aquila chrysaetos chrysaetos]|uniref:uncharacterized protein LOC121232514 isoform X3 n=1 Tax=Aquila chrysaetos chrysaetos TaxID=223781 RepID=UPI001B7D3272|nr:uncharacterized protein LOC121232514 isoform X3 [Aquila chrysaetos chrysaetos]